MQCFFPANMRKHLLDLVYEPGGSVQCISVSTEENLVDLVYEQGRSVQFSRPGLWTQGGMHITFSCQDKREYSGSGV